MICYYCYSLFNSSDYILCFCVSVVVVSLLHLIFKWYLHLREEQKMNLAQKEEKKKLSHSCKFVGSFIVVVVVDNLL